MTRRVHPDSCLRYPESPDPGVNELLEVTVIKLAQAIAEAEELADGNIVDCDSTLGKRAIMPILRDLITKARQL